MVHTLELTAPEAGATSADRFTFIGNATLLLQLNGITILTDPNFLHAGDHAHLGYGMTSPRLTNPAMEFAALPPLDAVLLSHYHGDHFDQNVERDLDRSTVIITTEHAARILRRKGFEAARALRTWDVIEMRKSARRLKITALPGRHGPPAISAALPPVMGSMLELPRADGTTFRMYISGDTLVFDELRKIPQRFAHIDLALLHLGGTRVLGVLVTMDGKGGVAALRILEPQMVVPIHYEEYPVMKSPLSEFIDEARRAGYGNRVRCLARGEEYLL